MKVVFVNRFFHPDLAPTGLLAADVAFHLASLGHEVHAVTSRQGYEDAAARLPVNETVAGAHIHRVWTTRFGRSSLLGRALDYATFYASAFLKLVALAGRGDVIVAKTDPPLISVVAALAAAIKGARLVNWQQDVFPEAAVELGFGWLGGAFGAPVRAARTWALRRAMANVALGERMAVRLAAIVGSAERVRTIPNWADGEVVKPVPVPHKAFVVGYSGNMGRAHELETLIAACVRLKDDPQVEFVFTGGGNKRSLVAAAMREHQLVNVRLRPYVPQADLSGALGECHVHIVSLLPALEGLIVPSKFYGIAAAGRPTVYIGDPQGEVGRLLARHGIGFTVRPGDVDGLVTALTSLREDEPQRRAMGEAARRVFEREWDRPVAMARWQSLLRELA